MLAPLSRCPPLLIRSQLKFFGCQSETAIPAASLFVAIIVLEVIAVTSTVFFLLFLPDHALILLLDLGKRRQPESSLTELTRQHSGVSQMTL